MSNSESEENAKRGGGMLGGMLIGGALGGPIGAVLGGLIGGAATLLLGRNMPKLRAKAYNDIAPHIDEVYKRLDAACMAELKHVSHAVAESLDGMFRNYAQTYSDLVSEMIRRDTAEKKKLTQLQREAAEDRFALKQRSELLVGVREKCLSL